MSSFSPSLRFTLQLAGLLPVSFDNTSLSGEVLRYSKAWAAYTIAVLFTSCLLLFYWCTEYHKIIHETVRWSTTTLMITEVGSTLSSFLGAVSCLVTAIIKVQTKIDLFEKLRNVDFHIHKNNISPRTQAASYIALLLLSFILFVEFVHRIFNHPFYVFIQTFKLVILCGLVEFMEIVLTVKDRFQLINDRIADAVARSNTKQLLWTVPLPIVESMAITEVKALRITDMDDTHWKLCQLVRDISALYGCQLVTTMVCTFFHLVMLPYNLFIEFSKRDNPKNQTFVFINCSWTFLVIGFLFILVVPCTMAVNEAKKTGLVVSKLMQNKMDDNTFKDLSMFAHNLYYRHVHFSACGLFILQTSVSVSVASVVTTYMAITIQFHSSVTSELTAATLTSSSENLTTTVSSSIEVFYSNITETYY